MAIQASNEQPVKNNEYGDRLMTTTPTVLGIGGSDHDVHACLIRDGKIQIAIEEERLSRKKYGIGGNLMEGLAKQYVLDRGGVSLDEVDHVVVDMILPKTALMGVRQRAESINHHLCHASVAWFTSGFDSAAVLVVDNAGGIITHRGQKTLQSTTWYKAKGRQIDMIDQVGSTNWKEGPTFLNQPYQCGDGDHSLGHFYKKVTGALGFRYPHDSDPDGFFFPEDGITMGLAAFSEPKFFDSLWQVVTLMPDGQFSIRLNDGELDQILATLLLQKQDEFALHAAIASSAQEVLTRILCHVVDHVMQSTGESCLCLAGGVAMNSVANGQILERTCVEEIYIPPVPGDNGTGVGAAIWKIAQDPQYPIPEYSVYSGAAYCSTDIEQALQTLPKDAFFVSELSHGDLTAKTSDLLAKGKIIAWFNGGSESGRRALGNRSILAAPNTADTRDHINHNLKRRQWFRPFAPVVIQREASKFFDLSQLSPYMQIVSRVKKQYQEKLAAVTHHDGTARVQTVTKEQNPLIYDLLETFGALTGIPILLNTSFNGRGQPIVETPIEAIECLSTMALDGLVLGNYLITTKGN